MSAARDPPDVLIYLWTAFCALHQTRPIAFGPGAISFAEIEAWSRLSRFPLTAWEVGVIRRLDRAFLEIHSEMNATK